MRLIQRRISVAVAAVFAACCGVAQADSSDTERIKALEKQIELLMRKVEQLEKTKPAEPAAPVASTQDEKIAAIEKHVAELSGGLSRRSAGDGLPVHGFADVGLMRSAEDNPTFKGRKGAGLGTFDLYLTPQFGDRVRGLVELAFEADQDGGIATDLERLQIGYLFSDAATGWLGRFHTPYGYWNTAFHHGAQIQTAVTRPRFLDFEDKGGILPAHTTGVWLNGTMPSSQGRLGYDLYVGNAPRITGTSNGTGLATANRTGFSAVVNAGTYAGSGTLNMQQSGSTSAKAAVGINAWIEPRAIDGLRVGVHGLRTEVVDDTSDSNRTLLRMTGSYFAYTGDPWEVLGEYYGFSNAERGNTSAKHSSWAGYLQAGYSVGRWTPYGRMERAKLDQTDNYFGVQASGRSYSRVVGGLRYELDPRAVIKLEFASTRKEISSTSTNSYPDVRLQYAISF